MTEPSYPDVPRHWRRGTRAEIREDRDAAQRRRRFTVLAGVLGLAGVIVILLMLLRPVPRPYYLPLFVAHDRSEEVSWVPLAGNELRAMAGHDYLARVLGEPGASQEKARMEASLAALKQLAPADTIVVEIVAQARTAADGAVSLLPADAELDDPETWIPLRDVLGWLGDCPAHCKLLILETTRPQADPLRGALADDAAARIAAALGDLERDGHLLVLCASAPGQLARDDEELGRSAFSYYLEEGLRGWADHDEPMGNRDGLVTARELARFVAARVGRWAMMNQGTPQVAVLYGPVDLDFPLVALAHGRPRPHLRITRPRTYPAWLRDAWKRRDGRRADGSDRLAPRAFRRMESALLDAETAWRGGVDPEILRSRWAELVPDLDEAFAQARDLPTPRQPRSLGLTELLDRAPAADVAKAVAAAVAKREEQSAGLKPEEAEKTEAKLVTEFLDATRGKPDFDVARAVFAAAADDPRPRIVTIRFLDRLLRATQPEPLFVETLFLRRLAANADALRVNPASPSSEWPIETIRRALDIVLRGERAAARPASLAWVRPLLDRAAQSLHEGELLLWQRGYVPPGRADELLSRADSEFAAIRIDQETVEEARRVRDEALTLLPATAAALDRIPELAPEWERVIEQVREVDQVLADVAAEAASPTSCPGIAFQQKVEALQRAADILKGGLDELGRPFGTNRLNLLRHQGREPDAGPGVVRACDALLATPLNDVDTRVTLWAARSSLARRLLERTLELDRQDSSLAEATPRAPDLADDATGWEAHAGHEAADRARRSIAWLALAGLAPGELGALDAEQKRLVATQAPLTAWLPLASRLRRGWMKGLPGSIPPDDLAGLDRLGRILPATVPAPALDHRRANPTAALRRRESTALWAWLADRYAYESHELDAAPLFAAAAREYQALAQPALEPYVQIVGSPEPVAVTAEHPTAAASLQLQIHRTPGTPPGLEVRILTAADDWLDVRPTLPGLARFELGDDPDAALATYRLVDAPSGPLTLWLRVERKPGGDRSETPPPRGFLVQAALGGRSFAYRVPATLRPAGEQLQILLSSEDRPGGPVATLGALRLRPAKARQPFYLYVRNPSKTGRTVLVDLKAGDIAAGGESPKLTLGPGQTQKVAFSGPTPKPTEPLDPLRGPLHVRLLDSEHGAVLQERTFPVSIAAPTEYVKVVEARFEPVAKDGGENHLTVALQAVAPPLDPPCPVDLVLLPGRIPGLVAIKDGTFHGILPDKPDKVLALFAAGLQLAPDADEQGEFSLTIDGIPRALTFRTTYARRGDPTTPRREVRTGLALHAEGAARSGAKLNVVVEVDNPPVDSHLELSLGHYQAGVFQADVPLPPFPTAQRQVVGFSPSGPAGALLLEAAIEDWTVALDTAGIQGRRELQARLIDGDGRIVKTASLPVVLDADTPRLVRFLDPPRQARRGSTATLKAIGTATDSGIKQVVFFVGKPEGDKLPPKAEPAEARRVPGAPATWTGELHLPEDKKGPTDISVQFVNGAGLSRFDTTTVELLDTDPVLTGGIVGTVLEGDRPQKDLDVLLGNDKGVVVGRTRSGNDGVFTFKDLPEGTYQLYSKRDSTQTIGRKIVKVAPGEPQQVELRLYR